MSKEIAAKRDMEGYLVDPEAWDDEIARELAAEEELELTDPYWTILHFMREYWREHQVTPDVRHVVGFLTSKQGMDKKLAKDQLFQLFSVRICAAGLQDRRHDQATRLEHRLKHSPL